ncbi:hypothetical protein PR048_007038 [Dryococelus australis]|uniref:Uncharacterized protein n=1 Tax=Dryococelus australis TaxID=614101 RepID=A0ABQ9ICI7_9NEOP|nr:hypothetical protein PR048_007038 [Dryococelus australis]
MQETGMAQKLKRMCPTQWAERHDSLRSFIELREQNLTALDVIAGTLSKRKTYLQTVDLDLNLAAISAMNPETSIETLRQNASGICNSCSVPDCGLCNVAAETPEQYFRRTVFIPFVVKTMPAIEGQFLIEKHSNHSMQGLQKKPQSANDALQICNANMIPTVYDLPTIMATHPLITCICEQ